MKRLQIADCRLQIAGVFVWAMGVGLAAPSPQVLIVTDADGASGRVGAPVSRPMVLTAGQLKLAEEGRLTVKEGSGAQPVAAQFEADAGGRPGAGRVWWLLPAGPAGKRLFFPSAAGKPDPAAMDAKKDPATGQVDVSEGGKPVLRYNYQTIEPGDLFNQVTAANRIYTRARSDYIHPLYGFDGEALTRDFPLEHPHHRGIYWAWPEVDYGKERGDLHALQRVWARPTGKLSLVSGPVFAQVEAENEWKWEDKEPIVREKAVIRAYRQERAGRFVDLAFSFTALKEGVTVARRGMAHYGGLNIRLAPVKEQEILFHTDPADARPRQAWADLHGTFAGAREPSGIMVIQSAANPDYPGDWVKYPELNWFQPTFPALNTRYAIKQGETLVLHFRLWIHHGAKLADEVYADQWRAYNGEVGK